MSDDPIQKRLAEIAEVQSAIMACWPSIKNELNRLRLNLVVELVTANNEETRGRIKQLDDMLELPQRLHQEALLLSQELP